MNRLHYFTQIAVYFLQEREKQLAFFLFLKYNSQ